MKKVTSIFMIFLIVLVCCTGCIDLESTDKEYSSEELSAVSEEEKGEESADDDSFQEENALSKEVEDVIDQFEFGESESAYIPVRMGFFGLNNKLKSDGKGYIDVIDYAESEDWENAAEIPQFIFSLKE